MQKRDNPPRGRGDGRPSGLSHCFLQVTVFIRSVCGPFITQGPTNFQKLIENAFRRKIW
jgi:hypothetical protein